MFRAPFSAVGTLVRLGDNASTDRLEITAETHVLAGLLHAHGDSQVGDTALCTDAEGRVVARGDATTAESCERTGNVWSVDMNGCTDPAGGVVGVLNATACELTGHAYVEDRMVVEALSTFNADLAVGGGADVTIGGAVGDGSEVLVRAPSTFAANLTLSGGAEAQLTVRPPAVFKSEFDVGGAVALHGPILTVEGNSTFISPVVAQSNVTLGAGSGYWLRVGASSSFGGPATFDTHVRFDDAAGLGETTVSIARDVDFAAEGDGVLGTSSEDSLVIRAATRTTAPVAVGSDFSVEVSRF